MSKKTGKKPHTPERPFDIGPGRTAYVRPETIATRGEIDSLKGLRQRPRSSLSADERATLADLERRLMTRDDSGRVHVPMARAGESARIEKVKGDPNKRKYRRHISAIDEYHEKGILNAQQVDIARRLQDVWFHIHGGPACAFSRERVDTSLDADRSIMMQIEKFDMFKRLNENVPRAARDVVDHVILQDRRFRDGLCSNVDQVKAAIEILRSALDHLLGR